MDTIFVNVLKGLKMMRNVTSHSSSQSFAISSTVDRGAAINTHHIQFEIEICVSRKNFKPRLPF